MQRSHEVPRPSPEASPPPNPPDPGGSPLPARGRAPEWVSVHVYGGKAALCFEADETRDGVATVALDAAAATGPQQYDWKNKLRLQLTRQELPTVLAVLCGFAPRAEFKNHGANKDKGFSVEHQGDKLFWRVFAREGGVRAVPMAPEDAFYTAGLFLRQLRKAAPWMGAGDLLALAQRVLTPPPRG